MQLCYAIGQADVIHRNVNLGGQDPPPCKQQLTNTSSKIHWIEMEYA